MLAKECATALGHSYIGTEHILWGLAREGTGIAASVLSANGGPKNVLNKKFWSL